MAGEGSSRRFELAGVAGTLRSKGQMTPTVGAERAARLAVEAGAMPVAVRSSEGLGLWPKRGNHDV